MRDALYVRAFSQCRPENPKHENDIAAVYGMAAIGYMDDGPPCSRKKESAGGSLFARASGAFMTSDCRLTHKRVMER